MDKVYTLSIEVEEHDDYDKDDIKVDLLGIYTKKEIAEHMRDRVLNYYIGMLRLSDNNVLNDGDNRVIECSSRSQLLRVTFLLKEVPLCDTIDFSLLEYSLEKLKDSVENNRSSLKDYCN